VPCGVRACRARRWCAAAPATTDRNARAGPCRMLGPGAQRRPPVIVYTCFEKSSRSPYCTREPRRRAHCVILIYHDFSRTGRIRAMIRVRRAGAARRARRDRAWWRGDRVASRPPSWSTPSRVLHLGGRSPRRPVVALAVAAGVGRGPWRPPLSQASGTGCVAPGRTVHTIKGFTALSYIAHHALLRHAHSTSLVSCHVPVAQKHTRGSSRTIRTDRTLSRMSTGEHARRPSAPHPRAPHMPDDTEPLA